MYCIFKLPIKKIKTTVFFCVKWHDNCNHLLNDKFCIFFSTAELYFIFGATSHSGTDNQLSANDDNNNNNNNKKWD